MEGRERVRREEGIILIVSVPCPSVRHVVTRFSLLSPSADSVLLRDSQGEPRGAGATRRGIHSFTVHALTCKLPPEHDGSQSERP